MLNKRSQTLRSMYCVIPPAASSKQAKQVCGEPGEGSSRPVVHYHQGWGSGERACWGVRDDPKLQRDLQTEMFIQLFG